MVALTFVNVTAEGQQIASRSEVVYDSFGRVWKERQLLPDGNWSVRETRYDSGGAIVPRIEKALG